jgi:hypothetical protein
MSLINLAREMGGNTMILKVMTCFYLLIVHFYFFLDLLIVNFYLYRTTSIKCVHLLTPKWWTVAVDGLQYMLLLVYPPAAFNAHAPIWMSCWFIYRRE